jgi:hypothetical protein
MSDARPTVQARCRPRQYAIARHADIRVRRLGSDVRRHRAYAALFGTVQQQAALSAFIEPSRLLGLFFLLMLPPILLMRQPRGVRGSRGLTEATLSPFISLRFRTTGGWVGMACLQAGRCRVLVDFYDRY